MSIHLSKEYGLNPATTVCWWCGEADGILFAGSASKRLFGTAEAPERVLINCQPCHACREAAARGEVTLVGFRDDTPADLRPAGHLDTEQFARLNTYRTGHMWRITLDGARRVFTGIDLDRQRFLVIPLGVARQVGLPMEESPPDEGEGGEEE